MMLWTLCIAFVISDFARGGHALRPVREYNASQIAKQMQNEPGVAPLAMMQLTQLLTNKYWSLHVPKTAGASWEHDVSKILVNSASIEGCYSWSEKLQTTGTFLLLRRPADQVLSMYFHCTSSQKPPQWAKELMPKTFGEWVRNWTDILQRGGAVGDFTPSRGDMEFEDTYNTTVPFKCYNPVNMQVQRMTCQKPYKYPLHADENLAVRNMHSAAFVGITEAYHESLCLFSAKMIGRLPIGCNCENKSEWESMQMSHVTHDVQHHSLADYPEHVTNAVNKLVERDRRLYQAAVARFMKDIDDVERDYGVKVLCESTKQALSGN